MLGQHLEVHTIYSVITNGKKGYSRHPETLRWVNWLDELSLVHQLTVAEMLARGFEHKSPIDMPPCAYRTNFGTVDPVWRQIEELRRKNCKCDMSGIYQWYDLLGKFGAHEADHDVLTQNR